MSTKKQHQRNAAKRRAVISMLVLSGCEPTQNANRVGQRYIAMGAFVYRLTNAKRIDWSPVASMLDERSSCYTPSTWHGFTVGQLVRFLNVWVQRTDQNALRSWADDYLS